MGPDPDEPSTVHIDFSDTLHAWAYPWVGWILYKTSLDAEIVAALTGCGDRSDPPNDEAQVFCGKSRERHVPALVAGDCADVSLIDLQNNAVSV